MITRDQFLQVDDKPLDRVTLPGVYGDDAHVFVRTMSAQERSDLEKLYADRRPTDDPGGFRWALLLATVVDESGKAFFQPSDRKAVMDKSGPVIETLVEAAMKASGFRQKDVELLEKNSEAGQSNASSFD